MRTSTGPQLDHVVRLDRRSATPLHRQIYDGLRRAILDGTLRPGARVPPTRVLAVDLGVSRVPVLTAYEQLLHEGYLVGRVGSGTYVSDALPDAALRATPLPARTPPKTLGRRLRRPVAPARHEGGLRPFRVSLPGLDVFPHGTWARLLTRRARMHVPARMAYGDPAGAGVLRAAIADHLRVARGVRCEPEQVLVVPGSQAALRLCADVLLGPGERVALEEPGYAGARAALGATGGERVPIRVDAEGLDVAALEAADRNARFRAVYVTPSHQYPLGVSMSAPRRLALLEWARRRGAWVIEDDYDSEFRYASRPLPALQGLDGLAPVRGLRSGSGAGPRDRHGRVIYVGTFSKVLFPALRVGYLVVPPSLWDAFVTAREALDLFSPVLVQLALADFLSEGHFERHLRRMRGVYLRRRDALLAGLTRHCAGALTVHNADAGLHVTTLLPRGVDDADVVRRLAPAGLTATALAPCYAAAERRSGLLLGFGGFPERRLLEAARSLGEVLRE